MSDQPIVVRASPTKAQVEAGLRQFILMAGPVVAAVAASPLGAKLHINETWGVFVASVSGVATVVSFMWGQYETHKTEKQKRTMAAVADDSVAVVK